MKYYIDITLLPSDDIGIHFLWSKVMMQVHLALVEIKDENQKVPVAVSFPAYREAVNGRTAYMGNKLRLLASNKADFESLNIQKWLLRLSDYLHVKTISEIPQNVEGYETYGRVVKAGNPDKHIRRRMKRKGETFEQASAYFESYEIPSEVKKYPFIQMKSLNQGEAFNLVIKRCLKNVDEVSGLFNTYGINRNIALPKF